MKPQSTQLTAVGPVAMDEISHQYLSFQVAGECYAVGILDVKEIVGVVGMTRVPMAPAHIRGVINLRGNVVPVIDLSARLGKAVSLLTQRSSIVLVEVEVHGERQALGMLVDEVKEILELTVEQLQPAPDFGTDIRTDFIQAMGRVVDSFMIILDVNHVLSVDELSQLQWIAESVKNDTSSAAA